MQISQVMSSGNGFSGRGSNMNILRRKALGAFGTERNSMWLGPQRKEWWELRLQRMVGAKPCSALWVMMTLLKGIKWGGIKKHFGCVALNDPAWPLVEGGREMKGQNSQFKWNFEIIYNLCLLILYPLVNNSFKSFKLNTTVFCLFLLYLEYALPLFLTYEFLSVFWIEFRSPL